MIAARHSAGGASIGLNQRNGHSMTRTRLFIIAGALTFICWSVATGVLAQNAPGPGGQRQGRRQRGGNVDPAQFPQRLTERYRERLEITDDSEWKALQPRIQKVVEARMALEAGRRGALDRGNRPAAERTSSDPPERRAAAPVDPGAEALQKAIDNKASVAELKAAAARYLASRNVLQADLEKAQEDLRGVLTQRQESIAMLSGLL
jgi:hypothetical protein